MIGPDRSQLRQAVLTTATLSWFDDGACDVKFLDLWSEVPLSYARGRDIDDSWHKDHHEIGLGRDVNGGLFRRAAERLLHYRFYPQEVMSHIGDFDLGDSRRMRVGDRIAQRIHLLRLFGRNVLDAIGMVEVAEVIDKPRRCGFTYVTAATHAEEGEWSAGASWEENDEVVLILDAISRPSPREPERNHRFMRSMQQRAHRLGIAHFTQAVRG